MPDLWTDLLSCLDLRLHPASTDVTRSEPPDRETTLTVFEGTNQQLEYHRLFGGQLLAQFVRAAASVCPDKAVKSIHVLFAREGKNDAPVYYIAHTQHRGRSFAALSITARQKGEVVATAAVSMHAAEEGLEHQTVSSVPPLLSENYRISHTLLPWELRTAGDLDETGATAPEYDLWMRTPEVGPELAPALVAYATDLSLIGTAILPLEGYNQRGNGTDYASATTSHTVWFHRPFRVDEWLLHRHQSPILAHGRCFGRGDILTEDGTLVASFAQEALLRFRP